MKNGNSDEDLNQFLLSIEYMRDERDDTLL